MIIGLAGRKRSGKDTVGGMIQAARLDAFVMAFATPLKEICIDVYDFSDEQIYGELKEVPDKRYPRADGTFLTPREAMEKIGTEWARSCYPNTWVDLAFRRIRDFGDDRLVVITDCRFINEAKRIIDAGGEVWRIYRKVADAVPATHRAESEMDTPEFLMLMKHAIANNGTLEELRASVRWCLNPVLLGG